MAPRRVRGAKSVIASDTPIWAYKPYNRDVKNLFLCLKIHYFCAFPILGYIFMRNSRANTKAWLAQSVEHLTLNLHKVNQKVAGSSPASGLLFYFLACLASYLRSSEAPGAVHTLKRSLISDVYVSSLILGLREASVHPFFAKNREVKVEDIEPETSRKCSKIEVFTQCNCGSSNFSSRVVPSGLLRTRKPNYTHQRSTSAHGQIPNSTLS